MVAKPSRYTQNGNEFAHIWLGILKFCSIFVSPKKVALRCRHDCADEIPTQRTASVIHKKKRLVAYAFHVPRKRSRTVPRNDGRSASCSSAAIGVRISLGLTRRWYSRIATSQVWSMNMSNNYGQVRNLPLCCSALFIPFSSRM